MKIYFTCSYSSAYGENLFIRLDYPQMPDGIELPMNYIDQDTWGVQLERDELPSENRLIYSITVTSVNVRVLAFQKMIDITKIKSEHVYIHVEPDLPAFFQMPVGISEMLSKHIVHKKNETKGPNFIISLQLPAINPDHIPCITGSSKKMGKWTGKPILFHLKNNVWKVKLKTDMEKAPAEFKIAIYDLNKKEIIAWEKGNNRLTPSLDLQEELYVLHAVPDLPLTLWKAAGINVPLSALKTENTWGCGDFTALKMLGDWCSQVNFKMIQLLPLYDTTATHTASDSYPYAPISAFALHPVLMDVQQLIRRYNIDLSDEMELRIRELNNNQKFHIEEVLTFKIHILRLIYDEVNAAFKDDFAWFTFFDLNRDWLQPYAAFCYLRDVHQTPNTKKWKSLKVYNESQVEEMVSRENLAYEDICFHYFIQYHLHLQLGDAKEHLSKKGIILKGDLPIGVGRNSVDTWMYPHLFHLDKNAGAPPDAFTQLGQNWGFPTYNWDAMKADNYTWFRKRLEHLETYFDAIRIDHIIGLFRMWSIDVKEKDGRLGIFEPAMGFTEKEIQQQISVSIERLIQPFTENDTDVILFQRGDFFHFRINMQQTDSFKNLPYQEQQLLDQLYHFYFNEKQYDLWKNKGQETLDALQQLSKMLWCAEDLGMVPSMVETALQTSNILCLRVERMPVNNDEFFPPFKAPYLSVVTPSTHDMSPLRQWWQEPEAPIQYYFNFLLQQEGLSPDELDTFTAKLILQHHLQSPAMFAVFLMQDLFSVNEKFKHKNGENERINDPAKADFEWNYRMNVSFETLLKEKSFSKELKKMIKNSGR